MISFRISAEILLEFLAGNSREIHARISQTNPSGIAPDITPRTLQMEQGNVGGRDHTEAVGFHQPMSAVYNSGFLTSQLYLKYRAPISTYVKDKATSRPGCSCFTLALCSIIVLCDAQVGKHE